MPGKFTEFNLQNRKNNVGNFFLLKAIFHLILAKSIPTIGLFVPAGFFISGKIKIFDIEAWGKIIIQPETSTFEVDIKMAPINWVNGLIKVQRNDENSKEGPICFIRASKVGMVKSNF